MNDPAGSGDGRPRIAVFAGANATIQNVAPLVTSNKVRSRHGLPMRCDPWGRPLRYDALRAQRLAAPVTVYVEQFSAHPLEADVDDLYGPPDGYLDGAGTFRETRASADDVPVYRIELEPSDGLYLLPYAARSRDGEPWDRAEVSAEGAGDETRQVFVPDPARIYEEIDRFGLDSFGFASQLSRQAEFDFYRAIPSAGWVHGDPSGNPPAHERPGVDFFPYAPEALRSEPPAAKLADATNLISEVLATGNYLGAQWLEGSPYVDESLYWFGLLIDTNRPIVGHSAQRPHGTASADGPRNVIDGVAYIASRAWEGESGEDVLGPVLIVDERGYAARDVAKVDGRPGGYAVTGGHGGVVLALGDAGPPQVTYVPRRRHTHASEVRLPTLPPRVDGVRIDAGVIRTVPIRVKDARGRLVGDAIPKVTIETYARYAPDRPGADAGQEPGILAWIAAHLCEHPLAGFVAAGAPPYGDLAPPTAAALRRAVMSGFPVVQCGRGNPAGRAYDLEPLFITGSNLTPVKARLLLMASLMKFGGMPPAGDPANPTASELAATAGAVARYQAVFDTH